MNTEKIRKDFPVLNQKKRVIYFDNACMSLRPVQVISKINEYYNEYPACGGRSYHKLGKKVTEEVNLARKEIKKFFNAKSEKEIIFTKNTTESINMIANSFEGKILTTDKEHNSNLAPWLSKKFKHEIVLSKKDNTFNIEDFKKKIKGTKLVSMVYTSNLDGTTIPAKEIIKIAHENKALVLLDAAQAAPHKEIDVKDLDVDFLACSGHKMLGPSGIGMLYGKEHLLKQLKPFIVGGDTVRNTTYNSVEFEDIPDKFEAGLQHYSGIIGFAEACRYLKKIGLNNINKHEIELNKFITNELLSYVELIGPEDAEQRAGIFSFNIKGIDPHHVAVALDSSSNIMIRSGQHCVHSWFNAHKMDGSARASLYLYNTKEEAELFVAEIKKFAKYLK